MTDEERERRVQISKDVLNEKDVGLVGRAISEAFYGEGTITEAEFYSAIGLHRIELALDVLINRLTSLPDHLK